MDANHKNPKEALDAAIRAARTAEPDRMDMENRAARVWARIGNELAPASGASSSVEQIRTCEDYRALIPDFIAGRLSQARALLLRDHTHECVACRNALNQARGETPRSKVVQAEHRFNRTAALVLVAASLIAAIALQQTGYLNWLLPVMKVHAVARTIDGKLYRIADLKMNPVSAGDPLKSGEPVRTAAESRAMIELADGTRIEMRERSQVSLTGAHDGIRINLDRGSVIVQAAKQRNGHLYVATDDCTVSVVGTVFAVSSGVKGSRVSVLEGEVHVSQASAPEKALFPGQQMTTNPSLTPVSIEDEISWSRNLDTHLALLHALAEVNAFLKDRIPGPQLRFTSALLPTVPANTVMYGAFPNVSSVLGQAYDLFRQKIDQNDFLKAWWAERNQRGNSGDLTLEEMIAHVRTLGDQLGEEVAVAVTGSAAGPQDLIVLAGIQNRDGVLAEISALSTRGSGEKPVRILTDPAQLAQLSKDSKEPIAYIGPSALVLTTSGQALYNVVLAQQTGSSGFSTRPFYASIAQAYAQGVGTLFAADLATVFSGTQRADGARFLGLDRVDRLVVEQKQDLGKTMTRAQLNFTSQPSGVVSWLAPPAPMGALEFVSPQAYGLASAVTKDALGILDEILAFGGDHLQEFQSQTGVDARRDLAEPLGGEFVIAMDGPFLPVPSWKVVAEVYDSARLQNSIERLVAAFNNTAAQKGVPNVTLTSEAVGGQVYYRLRHGSGTEVDYTYYLGYVIAAPSRGLVTQALQYQQTRSSISTSAKFRSMMPADGEDHCSAILYQNLSETASSLAGYIPAGIGGVTSDQLKVLRADRGR